MLIGYARVSTADQSLDLQLDALRQCGAERVFSDVASGKRDNRPGLTEALAALKAGDLLVVWKLDRLGRSLKHLVETVAGLQERGVGLKALTGGIDTTSAAGRLIFGIFAALAEFERELIRERTLAGWPQQGHVGDMEADAGNSPRPTSTMPSAFWRTRRRGSVTWQLSLAWIGQLCIAR